jgi:mitogen-activated protein kinase 1/3
MEREYHEVQVSRDVFVVDVRYTDLKPIGGGSYGFVCSAQDTLTGEQVAIKKVANVFHDLIDAKRILREIKLLRHFKQHENIIAIKDIITFPPNTIDFKDVYIITNLMESDLDRIISSSQGLTDQHFQYFLYQIFRGLKYIHSASVLHRDLKPSNLLVNANCDLSICDFGLARGVDVALEEALTEYVQTRWYRAPELLCETNNYDPQIDVWSVGCIFAEMLRRKPFFRGETPQHQLETIVSVIGLPSRSVLENIRSETIRKALHSGAESTPYPFKSYFPRDVNPIALDLLQKMLVFDPRERCTIEQALEHEYLSELHRQMSEPLCDAVFDFEFERHEGPSGVIPRADLQAMMFTEMQELLSQPGYAQPSPPRTTSMGGGGGGGGGQRSEGKHDDGKMDN